MRVAYSAMVSRYQLDEKISKKKDNAAAEESEKEDESEL
jgi:hypothetical protein|tara:strand:+ start:331 stop:447 length:117 start_codon:yes stop_codon:yes gene_type:complete